MMIPSRVKVVKPLRICGWLLEVGQEFDITEWNKTAFGTFFRPLGVKHMTAGMGWLFPTKTFNVITESDLDTTDLREVLSGCNVEYLRV